MPDEAVATAEGSGLNEETFKAQCLRPDKYLDYGRSCIERGGQHQCEYWEVCRCRLRKNRWEGGVR